MALKFTAWIKCVYQEKPFSSDIPGNRNAAEKRFYKFHIVLNILKYLLLVTFLVTLKKTIMGESPMDL